LSNKGSSESIKRILQSGLVKKRWVAIRLGGGNYRMLKKKSVPIAGRKP